MTGVAPFLSVIMATWGRGRHILPSVRSVLAQDHPAWELIVAGDHTTDETEAVVTALAHPRVRWINLDRRVGSQSGPNNAGIAAARGDVIAYLGHDDIWEPDHLSRIAGAFKADPAADFVVSGSISHLPNGLVGSEVRGIFTDDATKHRHIFPPSSLAHRKDVVDRIGCWRLPDECRAPVGTDFFRRAAAADLRFRSTGVVTVHKFPAAHRYLCYVQHSSDEQAAMLVEMAAPDHAERVAALVADAQQRGVYMVPYPDSFADHPPGKLALHAAARRGLLVGTPVPLGAGAVLRHRREPGALDWRSNPVFGWRWTKANPHPKLLLPYTGGRVTLTFRLVHRWKEALGPLDFICNGIAGAALPQGRRLGLLGWNALYRAEVTLRPDRASILELRLSEAQRPAGKRRGIAVGPIRLIPVV